MGIFDFQNALLSTNYGSTPLPGAADLTILVLPKQCEHTPHTWALAAIMTYEQLTQEERKLIKQRAIGPAIFYLIILTSLFGLIVIAVIVASYIFDSQPSDGFIGRGLEIIGTLVIIYILLMSQFLGNLLDLFSNKKIDLRTLDYTIEQKKYGVLLKIKSPEKVNLKLFENPEFSPNGQIRVIYTKWSKTVLSLYQNEKNLLEDTVVNRC